MMHRKTFLSLTAVLVLSAPLLAQEPQFSYSFTGQTVFEGDPGTTIQFEVVGQLTSTGIPSESGVIGWSLSTVATGATVVDVTTDDTVVSDVTAPGNRFVVAEPGSDGTNQGIVSAIALGLNPPVFLEPEGTFDIVRMTLEATVPEVIVDGDGNASVSPKEVKVFYQDGLSGSGMPVKNRVTYIGESFVPTMAEQVITVLSNDDGSRPTTIQVGPASGPQAGRSEVLLMDGKLEWASSLETGMWTGLSFTEMGAGDAGALLKNVRLVLDVNNNGTAEAGDIALGETLAGSDAANRAIFDFSGSPQMLTSGAPVRFLLLGQPLPAVEGTPVAAFLFPLAVCLLLSRLLRRRSRGPAGLQGLLAQGVLGLGLLLGAAAVPMACSSGGGGGGGSGVSTREVRFDVANSSDVQLTAAGSGIRTTVDAAPIVGPSVEL